MITSLIIAIPKPGKDTSQGTSYRPISLLCPAAKVLESLILSTINKYLLPAQDQHGFRCEHSTLAVHFNGFSASGQFEAAELIRYMITSLIIPIPKPGKDTSQGTSYRPILFLCPAAKVLKSLILSTINKYLLPAQDQHGFRRAHSNTSALL